MYRSIPCPKPVWILNDFKAVSEWIIDEQIPFVPDTVPQKFHAAKQIGKVKNYYNYKLCG